MGHRGGTPNPGGTGAHAKLGTFLWKIVLCMYYDTGPHWPHNLKSTSALGAYSPGCSSVVSQGQDIHSGSKLLSRDLVFSTTHLANERQRATERRKMEADSFVYQPWKFQTNHWLHQQAVSPSIEKAKCNCGEDPGSSLESLASAWWWEGCSGGQWRAMARGGRSG